MAKKSTKRTRAIRVSGVKFKRLAVYVNKTGIVLGVDERKKFTNPTTTRNFIEKLATKADRRKVRKALYRITGKNALTGVWC